MGQIDRRSLHAEVTAKIIAQIEEGILPWVQPWDGAAASVGLPCNASTGRPYSGINILLLWTHVIESGFASQRWLTFKQALAVGGNIRRGEKGATVCFADRFTPADEGKRAREEDREARQVPFLKRFTVFNVEQCENLPAELLAAPTNAAEELVPAAHRLMEATGASIHVGGGKAFYAPVPDYIQVPLRETFCEPINWYRTVLHELGHWTGHRSRLDRGLGANDLDLYAREELCAEMASAFVCAELGIRPTVRHADYIGAWLAVLYDDDKAVFKAASAASKAAEFLMSIYHGGGDQER